MRFSSDSYTDTVFCTIFDPDRLYRDHYRETLYAKSISPHVYIKKCILSDISMTYLLIFYSTILLKDNFSIQLHRAVKKWRRNATSYLEPAFPLISGLVSGVLKCAQLTWFALNVFVSYAAMDGKLVQIHAAMDGKLVQIQEIHIYQHIDSHSRSIFSFSNKTVHI